MANFFSLGAAAEEGASGASDRRRPPRKVKKFAKKIVSPLYHKFQGEKKYDYAQRISVFFGKPLISK